MKPLLLLAVVFLGLARAENAALESVLKSDWTYLYLSYGMDPGCTGIAIPESIFLSREGGTIKVYKVKRDDFWHEEYSKGRTISGAELQEILTTFADFYGQAEAEFSTSEDFVNMTEKEREKEWAKYVKAHGQPIGGLSDTLIFITYPPGDFLENSLRDRFGEAETFQKFVAWIQAEKGE